MRGAYVETGRRSRPLLQEMKGHRKAGPASLISLAEGIGTRVARAYRDQSFLCNQKHIMP